MLFSDVLKVVVVVVIITIELAKDDNSIFPRSYVNYHSELKSSKCTVVYRIWQSPQRGPDLTTVNCYAYHTDSCRNAQRLQLREVIHRESIT